MNHVDTISNRSKIMYTTTDLLDLNHTLAGDFLSQFEYPWLSLKKIQVFVSSLGQMLGDDYIEVTPEVWVHKTASIAKNAYLGAPLIIGANTEVRHCAFIRGSALIGENCVIGNSVEIKNSIIFDSAQVPHFNYVGDSILGYKSHMGAGSITSNIKSDKSLISVKGEFIIETGLKKFGSIIGDFVEIGCNSVLNPGTVIGRNTNIYPLSSVRGVIPAMSIYKGYGDIIKKVIKEE